MSARDRLLEQLAQHLRVNRHLGVQRRRLHDGEVVAVEQPGYHMLNDFVGDGIDGVAVKFRLFEQATIEEWHLADDGSQALRSSPARRGCSSRRRTAVIAGPGKSCRRPTLYRIPAIER